MPWDMTIHCDGCSFESSISVLWGIFKYVLPNDTSVSVKRRLGWCDSCRNLQAVEKLPTETEVARELQAHMARLHEIEKLFLKRLFRLRRSERKRLQRECVELRTLSQVLTLRKTPKPRCLECGSTEVTPIDFPTPKMGMEIKTDIQHPHCGGLFHISCPNIHLVVDTIERLYDVEGNLISQQLLGCL